MQNSGLNNAHRFLKYCGIVCGAIAVIFFTFLFMDVVYSISKHNATMKHFESAFARIEHPQGTERIEYRTYFGADVSAGSGYGGCKYHIAEIRLMPDVFANVVERYSDVSTHFTGELIDTKVSTFPVFEETVLQRQDYPLAGWIEEYFMKGGDKNAYIVYAKKIDEENAGGDYRCWWD